MSVHRTKRTFECRSNQQVRHISIFYAARIHSAIVMISNILLTQDPWHFERVSPFLREGTRRSVVTFN